MKIDPSSYSLRSQISLGEDSTRQFKADVTNGDSLASEMAAFANSEGGTIFIGVADDGSTPGLSQKDVARINQLISNAASQQVRSPLTVQTENVALENGRIVIVLTVPKGIDKPYFDKNGVIWLKTGADKRRVNSKEELRRLFQISDQFHADELPTKAGIDKLDKLRFRDFLRDVYKQEYPDSPAELTRLLQNMNLATDDGNAESGRGAAVCRTAGVDQAPVCGQGDPLSRQRDPCQRLCRHGGFFRSLRKIFDDALAFVMRNLHKVQAGRGVNAPGMPEIPEAVFEELLVNALVHRDYLVSATDSPVYLRQPHRDHQPRPSAQQPDGGENSGRESPISATRFWFRMSPRGFCPITALARALNGRWKNGRRSTLPMIGKVACSPPRFTGSRWKSWNWRIKVH